MSQRGKRLFDHYVATQLNDPHLAVIGLHSHVHALTALAYEQNIPIREVTEEVGPLPAALAKARSDTAE